MYLAKLGKITVTSTISLVALLAAAGMSSAQAATPVPANANVSVSSSVKMTPHIFENTIITVPPLAPLESGLCGQAGLDPVLPDTSALPYHYEVRNNVIIAVANKGNEFHASITEDQRKWIFNPAYYSCSDPVVPNADMFITQIDVPLFGRECDPVEKQIVLSDTTDKFYYYVIEGGYVIAKEKTNDHIIQQDTVKEWPIELSTETCEITAPVAPVAPPVVDPSYTPVEDNIVSPGPISESEADVVDTAPVDPAAAAAVDSASSVPSGIEAVASANLPPTLANTGPSIVGLAFGVALMAVSIGTALRLKMFRRRVRG